LHFNDVPLLIGGDAMNVKNSLPVFFRSSQMLGRQVLDIGVSKSMYLPLVELVSLFIVKYS
jgi:hypothetical protein